MLRTALIALGGATGSVLRYWMSNGVHFFLDRGFPYGTLVVNILGSFIIGSLYVLLYERLDVSPEWRALLIIGILGGFTTFSSFSVETMNLIEAGAQFKAGMNIILSLSLCISACWVGMVLARQI